MIAPIVGATGLLADRSSRRGLLTAAELLRAAPLRCLLEDLRALGRVAAVRGGGTPEAS